MIQSPRVAPRLHRIAQAAMTELLKQFGAIAVCCANLFAFEAHVSVTREQLMYRFRRACLLVLATIALDARIEAGAQQPAPARTPSAPNARVFFIDLKDGATIPSKVKLRFGIENMEIAPAAGVAKPNTGHHHLLVDAELPRRSISPFRVISTTFISVVVRPRRKSRCPQVSTPCSSCWVIRLTFRTTRPWCPRSFTSGSIR